MIKINHFSLFLKQHLIPILIILLIGFPFSIFFLKVFSFSLPPFNDTIEIFSITLFQAIISFILCFTLALVGALGLVSFADKKYYPLLEWMYLVPLFLPSIVIAGSIMDVFKSLSIYPIGFFPLVICHAFSYAGGVAVFLARLMMTKCFSLCEWARVQGIPPWKLYYYLLRYVLLSDIQLLMLTVFCFCFTSLSIPLLVGGPRWKTIEVVIYEYLKDVNQWSYALAMLALEILFVFIISLFVSNSFSKLRALKPISYLGFKGGGLVGIFPFLIICMGLTQASFYLPEVFKFDEIFQMMISTFILSISVGIGTVVCLSFIALFPSVQYLKKFLIGYGTPSVVLTGFAFLIFFSEQVYFSWIFGLIILFLPSLYRWGASSFLQSLENQILVSKTFGASLSHIFIKIIWPQCYKPFLMLAGVSSVWASGDFAFTMIVSQEKTNLAILAKQLLGQYRWEQGLAVVLIFLFIGSLCFLIFGLTSFAFNFYLKKKY